MTGTAAIYDPSASPPLVAQGGVGTISGGLLRPGAIDQRTFLSMLQAQQSAREAAGAGGQPVTMPLQPFQGGIPTLTPAQFAALVGDQGDPGLADPAGGPAADPQTPIRMSAAALNAGGSPIATGPTTMAAPIRLSGMPVKPAIDPAAGQPTASATASADTADEAPTFSRASDTQQAAAGATTATAAAPATAAATPPETSAGSPTSAAAPSDPNLVHLKNAPTREEQQRLQAAHKRWIVDETPGSRQLFFGADGVFGWDDFLDLINPLQHIPIVAQIYQAITGDVPSGASQLLGAVPFGPIGAVGMLGAIADLAVKDVTGKDIGGNLVAMAFGSGKGQGAAGAAADTAATAQGGAGDASGGSTAATETAAAPTVSALEAAREEHNNRRA